MHKDACKKAAAIDSGYRIFIAPYSEANPKHNILVLISRTKFPAPWWLQRSNATEAEVISSRWKTKHCGQTSYLHTKSVNWCEASLKCSQACPLHPSLPAGVRLYEPVWARLKLLHGTPCLGAAQ